MQVMKRIPPPKKPFKEIDKQMFNKVFHTCQHATLFCTEDVQESIKTVVFAFAIVTSFFNAIFPPVEGFVIFCHVYTSFCSFFL